MQLHQCAHEANSALKSAGTPLRVTHIRTLQDAGQKKTANVRCPTRITSQKYVLGCTSHVCGVTVQRCLPSSSSKSYLPAVCKHLLSTSPEFRRWQATKGCLRTKKTWGYIGFPVTCFCRLPGLQIYGATTGKRTTIMCAVLLGNE